MTDKHQCHARGCSRHVAPKYLMCGYHWRKVPAWIQAAVWKLYVEGQEETKRVSKGYLVAARAAVDAVAYREDRIEERVFIESRFALRKVLVGFDEEEE